MTTDRVDPPDDKLVMELARLLARQRAGYPMVPGSKTIAEAREVLALLAGSPNVVSADSARLSWIEKHQIGVVPQGQDGWVIDVGSRCGAGEIEIVTLATTRGGVREAVDMATANLERLLAVS